MTYVLGCMVGIMQDREHYNKTTTYVVFYIYTQFNTTTFALFFCLQWFYYVPAGCKELKNACKMVMLQYAHVMKTCAILAKGLDLILVW